MKNQYICYSWSSLVSWRHYYITKIAETNNENIMNHSLYSFQANYYFLILFHNQDYISLNLHKQKGMIMGTYDLIWIK